MTLMEPTVEGFQLSPQQARLWELALADDTARCEVVVEGELDTTALRSAVGWVVARHEILRTSLHRVAALAVPLQVIAAEVDLTWETAVPDEDAARPAKVVGTDGEGDGVAEDGGGAAGQRAATLSVHLIREAPQRHRLRLSLPQACADRMSLAQLVAEIAAAYADGEGFREVEVVQYVDLAAWQNDLLESEETAEARERWRAPDEEAARLFLPSRHRGAPAGGAAMQRVRWSLGPERTDRVEALAHAVGFTDLRALLLAAWAVLVGRLAGRPEVVVGTAFDGRKYEEISAALGPFLRYLPIPCRTDPALPFPRFAVDLEGELEEAHRWQEYFPGYVRLGASDRTPTIGFDYEAEAEPAYTAAGPDGAGPTFRLTDRRVRSDRFELELRAARHDGGLCLEVHFDPAVYAAPDAHLLLESFDALLVSLAAAPTARVGDLSLLSERQRQLVVHEVNATTRALDTGGLHDLFRRRARAQPDRVAIRSGDRALTYGELDRRSDRLAVRLEQLGIGPEVAVAVCLERSPELVETILAVLKAGGAWVPLDPAQPPVRLRRIVERSGAALVISRERLRGRLPATGAGFLALDSAEPGLADGAPAACGVGGDHLAYQLFTSGSTGEPKGVLVTHRAIANRVLWFLDELGLEPGERVVGRTPPIFDASIWETFAPLLAGAELVLAAPDAGGDPARLVALVERTEATLLQAVPSLLEVILEQPAVVRCRSLRRVFCGGEALGAALADRYFELATGELHNLYGPTETTIDATHGRVEPVRNRAAVPIGRPIANVRVHVLNGRLEPVAVEEGGELWIGGAGLARGYAGSPAATADAFRPDPLAGEAGGAPGDRLYRTGDLARLRPDGELEFLGRSDQQVKLRGFRIELGEIEMVLGRRPDVLQAVVILRDDLPGGAALVAYAVPVAGGTLEPDELRQALGGELPHYMVPAAVVVVPALPRTAGGKIDRRALPAPQAPRGAAGVGPRNTVEAVLATIWCDLLDLPSVGVAESFFEIGGHSLLATQLLARIRDSFGVELSLRTLFEAATVEAQARRVEEHDAGADGFRVPPLVPIPRDGELTLSFGQQRLWFIEQLQPGSAAYHVSSAVRLVGHLDFDLLRRTVAEVVRRHEVLRTRFPSHRGHPRQEVLPPGPVPVPRVDLSSLAEDRRTALAEDLLAAASHRSFDLERGPLLRLLVVRTAATEHLAGITLHHAVSDGWSTTLLVQEVVALYAAFSELRPSPLPELPVQYADFAAWQRSWLQGEELERQLVYWRQRLHGAPALLELPLDRPRPARQGGAAGMAARTLPRELTDAVESFGRQRGVTPFMVLLGGLQVLLGRYAGQLDVTIGTPVAGRRHTELESLIGFFINTLVMRGEMEPTESFGQRVRQVRERAIEGHAHQDLPFEKLLEELEVERRLEYTPLFQVLYSHQNLPARGLRLPGLRVEPVEAPGRTAKFDLTLVSMEVEAGLHLVLEYRRALYDAATAERLLEHYERLLAAVVASPEAPAWELPLLSAAERRQLVTEWGGASESSAERFVLPQRFAAVASRPGRFGGGALRGAGADVR